MKIILCAIVVTAAVIYLRRLIHLKREYEDYVQYTKNGRNQYVYHKRRYSRVAAMDWDSIKAMYAINPKRWDAIKNVRRCGYDDLQTELYLLFNGGPAHDNWHPDNVAGIILSFSGWKKFKKAYDKKQKEDTKQAIMDEKKKENEKIVEDTQFIVDRMKIEIVEAEKQSKRQIESAYAAMQEIQARMKEGDK